MLVACAEQLCEAAVRYVVCYAVDETFMMSHPMSVSHTVA
jgi:hypothetical protein